MCVFASDGVSAGLFRVRSEAIDCVGRVHTLCANAAIPPVSGRILGPNSVVCATNLLLAAILLKV